MKFGQRYDGKGHISKHADYVQFNICGLSAIDIVQRYFLYEVDDKPMILLGDYTSEARNSREDDMLVAERIFEIKDAITSLKAFGAEIWAITLHPVSKVGLRKFGTNDMTFKQYIDKLNDIYQIPVLVKNRQYDSLHLSSPEEIIEFSYTHKLTLDVMHLYHSCNYEAECYLDTISKINMKNVQEIHVRNMSLGSNGIVGNRELSNFEEFSSALQHFKEIPWATFVCSNTVGSPQFDSLVVDVIKFIRGDGRDS